jgi:AcrR family transcriptional regulator
MHEEASITSLGLILDAALAELMGRGVDDFTVDGVAGRAGVDPAVIYHVWHDRRVMLMNAMLHASGERMPISDTGSLRDDILAYVHAVSATSATEEGVRYLRSLLPQPCEVDLGEVRRDYYDIRCDELAEIFRRASKRGDLRDGIDPRTAAHMLAAAISVDSLWYGRPNRPDYLREVVDIFIRGITC